MAEGVVSNKTANQLIHQSLNQRISQHKKIFKKYQQYIDKDVTNSKCADIADALKPVNADLIMTPYITQYLAKAQTQNSSFLAQMSGGQVFQILRTFRDQIYTSQSRESRLLEGFRGQLIRAKMNITLGKAFT